MARRGRHAAEPPPIEEEEAPEMEPETYAPEDEIAQRISELRDQLGESAKVGVDVEREEDANPGQFTWLDYIRIDAGDVGDVRPMIARRFGGGHYRLRFRVGGRIGPQADYRIDGDPIRVRRTPDEPPAPPLPPQVNVTTHAGTPSPELAAVQAQLDALRKEREAEREAARAREEAAKVAKIDRLEDAVAAIAAKINAPPPAPVTPHGPDPMLTRALDQAEAAQKELAGALKRAEKAEADARATVMEKQLAAITELVKQKPKKTKDPLAKVVDRLGSVAAIQATFKAMQKANEEDGDDWLGDLVKPFKRTIRHAISGAVERAGVGASDRARKAAERVGTFPQVVQEILERPAVVADRAWVRAVTAAYPALMVEMTQLASPEAVQAFVVKNVSAQAGEIVAGLDPEKKTQLMEIVAHLRATFIANASEVPRRVRVVKRVRVREEPEPEVEDLDEEDGDEDEEEESDEDEEEGA